MWRHGGPVSEIKKGGPAKTVPRSSKWLWGPFRPSDDEIISDLADFWRVPPFWWEACLCQVSGQWLCSFLCCGLFCVSIRFDKGFLGGVLPGHLILFQNTVEGP